MNCRCGDPRGAHAHYRRGRECALCRCPAFRRPSLRARCADFLFGLGLLVGVVRALPR